MWSLPPPDSAESTNDLIKALTYADGTPIYSISEAESHSIIELYEHYDFVKGRPTPALLGPALSSPLKTALHNAYAEVQNGRRLEHLRSRLKLNAARCPYCGISAVRDLDHYLPRSHYQIFSIYSRNLVPACPTCNNKKRAAVGQTPAEHFIHAYFDDLPNEVFLNAEAGITNGALTVDFYIEQTPSMSDELFNRLQLQMDRLELSERYLSEVNNYLGSLETAFSDAYDAGGAAGLIDFLVRSANNIEQRFNLNDWRAALLRALSRNADFCAGQFQEVLNPA